MKMGSCDDEFSLLGDDNHELSGRSGQQEFSHSHDESGSATQMVCSEGCSTPVKEDHPIFDVNPYHPEFDAQALSQSKKRKHLDDLSLSDDIDASTPSSYNNNNNNNKKHQLKPPVLLDYRKDREEWTDSAIHSLLDAYTHKYLQLNRGNLRGRDWEEVASIVSQTSHNHPKSVEQCKNKVDNLKKRYKLERHRMASAGVSLSHWPWFDKMETIVANSLFANANANAKPPLSDDHSNLPGASSPTPTPTPRHHKRYSVAAPDTQGQINNIKSKSVSSSKWQRVVFKISGAALAGCNGTHSVDPKVVMLIAREVAMACRLGVQVGIVIGGRNFFCGDAWINATGADRSTTYQIGMMATLMNSVLLQSALEKMGVQTRLQSTFSVPEVGEPYNRQKAIRHLEKGRVVIFGGVGGSSGNPLFSTDTTAALRASDIHAHAVLKGASVEGIYDCHSRNNGMAFEHISFREAASRGPSLIDLMALTFCEENGIPVVVFNLLEPGNISRALCGEQIGTLIDQSRMIS